MLTAVLLAAALASAAGYWLVYTRSPDAARDRALVDALLLVALAVVVWGVLSPTLKRVEGLVDALRALARGERHQRVDVASFAGLAEIARATNEVAAALCEDDDPNAGPVRAQPRSGQAPVTEPRATTTKGPTPKAPAPARRAVAPVSDGEQVDGRQVDGRQVDGRQNEEHDDLTPRLSDHPELGPVRVRKREPPAKPAVSTPVTPTASNDTLIEENSPASVSASEVTTQAPASEDIVPVPERPELEVLFASFVAAKRAQESTDDATDVAIDVDLDAFIETIRQESQRLIEAHRCRGVRFEVTTADSGEVSLRPRLLR